MRTPEFGRTHVVRPRGIHKATIVWLHGLGDNGSSWSQILEALPLPNWSQILEALPLPNIKWICPTAPVRPVAAFGGFSCTAWFDAKDISEDAHEDQEGLDVSAAHVANLLSTEPADVKLGIGGFSMGAATALYSAMCHALGQYGNGNLYQVNLQSVVSLSGWLPCSGIMRKRMEESPEALRRAASLPILLCHGSGDDMVAYTHGEKSAQVLRSTGFQNLIFIPYEGSNSDREMVAERVTGMTNTTCPKLIKDLEGRIAKTIFHIDCHHAKSFPTLICRLGHYHIPEEIAEVCQWLVRTLKLDGSF